MTPEQEEEKQILAVAFIVVLGVGIVTGMSIMMLLISNYH